jgi:hypothetical protein
LQQRPALDVVDHDDLGVGITVDIDYERIEVGHAHRRSIDGL